MGHWAGDVACPMRKQRMESGDGANIGGAGGQAGAQIGN